MPSRLLLALPLAAVFALAPAASEAAVPTSAPSTEPVDPAAAFLLDQRQALVNDMDQGQVITARPIEKLIELSVENGHLVARLLPPVVPDDASMKLPGEGAIVIKRLHSRANPENESLDLQYLKLDAADAKHPHAVFFQLMTDLRGLSLTLNEQTPTITTSGDLIDHPVPVPGSEEPPISSLRFSRQAEDDAGAKPNDDPPATDGRGAYFPAANFTALLDAHHDAVVSAMSEALISLRAMHVLSGLSDDQARQLMNGDAAVDADVALGVRSILDSLKADGADAVEASVAKLAKLGPTAVAALGAADRKGWSPDLKLSVDTVLAQVTSMPASRAQSMLAAPARLIDLLYWPDASIRKAAAKRLEATLGKQRLATFDADRDPYAQTTWIEAARAALPHDDNAR